MRIKPLEINFNKLFITIAALTKENEIVYMICSEQTLDFYKEKIDDWVNEEMNNKHSIWNISETNKTENINILIDNTLSFGEFEIR